MPYKDSERRKQVARESMKKKRNVNPSDVNPEKLTPDVNSLPLFPPSKFLSYEEDLKVQENVVNTLKGMSGVRLQQFMGLSNTFTPNKDRK